jgi:hypothetical protein
MPPYPVNTAPISFNYALFRERLKAYETQKKNLLPEQEMIRIEREVIKSGR